MSDVFLSICGREVQLSSTAAEAPESVSSKWIEKNRDLIYLVLSVVFATLAILFAYDVCQAPQMMWQSGMYTACAIFMFVQGVLTACSRRGCIVIRPQQTTPK